MVGEILRERDACSGEKAVFWFKGGVALYINELITCTIREMTTEATLLMNEALKRVKISGSFSPIEMGARIGLNRPQAEAAARALSNAGVLVLGFDFAAHFSPDYRKANTPVERKAGRKK